MRPRASLDSGGRVGGRGAGEYRDELVGRVAADYRRGDGFAGGGVVGVCAAELRTHPAFQATFPGGKEI